MGIETESLDVGRDFGGIPQGSAANTFTATAFFLKDDVNTYNYFKNFADEIDEMTGPGIIVYLADPVDKGDARGVARVFDPNTAEAKRFPNLKRSDLPCLWLEDKHGGTSILKISDDVNATKRILRTLADVVNVAKSASDLQARVMAALRENPRSGGTIPMNPLDILREAIKAVPSVKYALAVAGVLAAISIGMKLVSDWRVAVIGAICTLLLMILMVIFARLSTTAAASFRGPIIVLTWFSVILLMVWATGLTSSVFAGWPLNFRDSFVATGSTAPAPAPARTAAPRQTFIVCHGELESKCRNHPYTIFEHCGNDNGIGGADPQASGRKYCGNSNFDVRPADGGSIGGNHCGYSWFTIACK